MAHLPRILRALPVAPVLLVALWGLAGPASAKTTKKTYTTNIVFQHRQNPDNPGNCSTNAFAVFPRVVGATSAAVTWKLGGRSEAKGGTGPLFDDIYHDVARYTAPSSKHWVEIGYSGVAGPGINTCAESEQKLRELMSTKAKIVVTIDRARACKDAKAAKKANEALAKKRRMQRDGLPAGATRDQYEHIVESDDARTKRAGEEVRRAC